MPLHNKSMLENACDCHLHVIGPKVQYPLAKPRAYTPKDARLDQLLDMHNRIGMERMVLIQTSVFGYDNSCMLEALKLLGDRARAIAVVPETTSNERLDELHHMGVRGLRVNIASYGERPPNEIAERLLATAKMCVRNNWHVQLFTLPNAFPILEPILKDLPCDVVIDHFGVIPAQDERHPAEEVMRRLLSTGKIWVKISGAYRLRDDDDFTDARIGDLARRLFKTNPSRILWGTDWPHPGRHGAMDHGDKEASYRDVDAGDILNELIKWFENKDELRKILVENPAALFDF